jgi:hypothetical protein
MSKYAIFASQQSVAGVMSADSVFLNFPSLVNGNSGIDRSLGTVAQSVQSQWGRPVTKLFALGSSRYYYVQGRPQGQVQLATVVAVPSMMNYFYRQFGNDCDTYRNDIELGAESACVSFNGVTQTQASVTYTIRQCMITDLSITMAVQDSLLNNNVTLLIGALEVTDSSE